MPTAKPMPYPNSLCHTCAAPPRYIQSARSIFILCPLLDGKYPCQPVTQCDLFKLADKPCAPMDAAGPKK